MNYRNLKTVLLTCLLFAGGFHGVSSVSAQSLRVQATGRQPMRVQVTMQVQTPVPPVRDSGEIQDLMLLARQKIYEMASAECKVLAATFKAECRLVNVNASSTLQDRGQGVMSIHAQGNSTYEMTQPQE